MKNKLHLSSIQRIAIVSIVALIAVIFPPASKADAAQVTSLSDVMSRLKASTASNHEIKFVTPTGVAAGQTIILTFSSGFTNVTNIVFTDIDFATGDTSNCSTATFTEKTLAASASGTTWGADGDSTTTVTITSGTGTVTAGVCVRIRIGTNAVTGATGSNQISNGATGSADTIAVSGTFTDSGTLNVDIITDDQVVITATVDPTLTFSISDTTVGFGTLSTATGRWATGNLSGANASAGTDPTTSNTAHTLNVATNAQSGYIVSYNGTTLTSGSNTIAVATISSDSDGTPNSAQFALCGKATTGSQTVTSGYVCSTTSSYNFVASTTTTLVTYTGPASGDVTSVAYLANISGSTQAGAYTSTITYIATATF